MTEEQRERNRQYNKGYRLKNPEYFKAYREKNKKPKKIQERVRRFAETGLSLCRSGHTYTGQYCKPCRAAYYETKGNLQEYRAEHYLANRDSILAKTKKYRIDNPEKAALSSLGQVRKRQAAKKKRTPPWYNHAEAKAYYAEAKKAGLVVDHIIPLRGKRVSGLHWAHNLQLLSADDNARKSNKFDPDAYIHELPGTMHL